MLIPKPWLPTSRRPSPGATAQTSAGTVVYYAGMRAFAVVGSHTYAGAGTFRTTVSIRDYGGASTQAAGTANVAGASSPAGTASVAGAPSAATGLTLTAMAGLDFDGVVAKFTSADPTAVPADFTATIAWGDGQTSAGSIAYDPSQGTFLVTGSHTYAGTGSYTATVSIRNNGGASTDSRALVNVAGDSLVAQGLSLATRRKHIILGRVASFTEFGTAAPRDFIVTIRWGDRHRTSGHVIQPGGPGTTFFVRGGHFYASGRRHIISITIAKRDGSQSVTVHSLLHLASR